MTLEQRIADLAQAMGEDVKTLSAAIAAAGGAPRTWASGLSINQGELVLSPTDWELYRRVAPTGSGAVDPADDTGAYRAVSFDRVTSIATPNVLSNGVATSADFANGATKVLPGAIAVGTRTKILALAGRGSLTYLGWQKANSGGGRFELIVDGLAVFDASIQTVANDTTVLVGAPGLGVIAGPAYRPAYYAIQRPGVEFRRSIDVWFTPAVGSTSAQSTLGYITRLTG